MTDKLDKAEAWLLKQNPQYMPSMSQFRKRFDLSLEELGTIVSRNQKMSVRMEIERESTPLPEQKPAYSMGQVFQKITPADMTEIQSNRVGDFLMSIVAEMGDLMNRADVNDCYIDVPHDSNIMSSCEWPAFHARMHVTKVGSRYKFELTGEWDLNKQD